MRFAIMLLLAALPRPSAAEVAPAPGCKRPTPPETVPLPARATALAAREAHACAVLETGRVWCWGNNDFEQAGSAVRAAETTPHDIGLAHVVEISLGYSAGCARHADGTTTCWGRKTSWNESLPQSQAARIPAGRVVQQVAAGHDHACAIVRGAVECYGALGTFSGFPDAQPRVAGVARATALAAGDNADCAIAGGAAVCWGRPFGNSCEAQCERDRRRPVAHRVPGIGDATAITVGAFDACAVHRSGRVACWGSINGARDGVVKPVPIAGLTDARQISSGMHHACAVRATGEIACWGDGHGGARGDGRSDGLGEVPSLVAGIDNAVAVATGAAMTCALRRDGRVACWGANEHRQLGFATDQRSATPVPVCGLDHVTQLAASYATTCALRGDGTMSCWGAGWGAGGHKATPVAQPNATGIVELAGSERAICARDRAGGVRCWSTWRETITVPATPVTAIAVGRFGSCGVHRDGTVSCGGAVVAGIARATRIAVGDQFACALAGGALTCWGPDTIVEPPLECLGGECFRTPVDRGPRTSSLPNIVDIRAISGGICARTADGRVRCSAPTSPIDARTPEATVHPWATATPGNLSDVTEVVRGGDHACALRRTGLVACWGDNAVGQLGTGTTGITLAP